VRHACRVPHLPRALSHPLDLGILHPAKIRVSERRSNVPWAPFLPT
jgi:hypothetical protein